VAIALRSLAPDNIIADDDTVVEVTGQRPQPAGDVDRVTEQDNSSRALRQLCRESAAITRSDPDAKRRVVELCRI
jgi:hypothetical protein